MRKLVSLIKVQLNARYGFSYVRYNLKHDRKTFWKTTGLGLAILVSLAQVAGLYTYFMKLICEAGAMLNSPQMVITAASIISGLSILIPGISYILGNLFLAKDTEFLSSLPLPQGSIFLSKFMIVLTSEYPLALFFMLPPVIVYGISAEKGVLYYILAMVCTLFLPLMPLVISTFVALLLMRIVSRSKRRELITTVSSILFIILIILGQNFLISRMPENKNAMAEILQNSEALIKLIGRAFPPSVWVTKTLSAGGFESFINLLYFILASAGSLALVYFLASAIYQKGAAAQLETGSYTGKRKLSYGVSHPVTAIFKNEWRILLRTPVYALNSLTVIFIAPLIMLMPLFRGNFAKDPDLQFLYDLVAKEGAQSELLLIVAAIIVFLALINPAISTAFSREGKNIWILRSIPVEPEIQVMGKFLAGYSISLFASVVTAVVAMLSFRLSVPLTAMILILCMLALIPPCAVSLYIDLLRPKLSWNNPQQAMKQNMNSLYGMLLSFLITSLFVVAGYWLNKLNLNIYVLFGILALLLSAVAAVSISFLKKSAKAGYEKIEA
ncbi:MAG TPA: hypothetical protein DD738_07135 [Ruminiclostridium sp.]|nr:hypothetical protein [Ruminiclostridium sp.]